LSERTSASTRSRSKYGAKLRIRSIVDRPPARESSKSSINLQHVSTGLCENSARTNSKAGKMPRAK
jgi:hypothetical protein